MKAYKENDLERLLTGGTAEGMAKLDAKRKASKHTGSNYSWLKKQAEQHIASGGAPVPNTGKPITKKSRQPKITSRKFGGDDMYSHAVFVDGRPIIEGLNQNMAQYYKKQIAAEHGVTLPAPRQPTENAVKKREATRKANDEKRRQGEKDRASDRLKAFAPDLKSMQIKGNIATFPKITTVGKARELLAGITGEFNKQTFNTKFKGEPSGPSYSKYTPERNRKRAEKMKTAKVDYDVTNISYYGRKLASLTKAGGLAVSITAVATRNRKPFEARGWTKTKRGAHVRKTKTGKKVYKKK